jgi:dienelactone hydrolase
MTARSTAIPLLALVTACGKPMTPATPPPPPSASSAASATAPEREAAAIVDALARHDWAAVAARFDPTMRAAVPVDKLSAVWEGVEGQIGRFAAVERTRVEAHGPYQVVLARCRFERGAKVVKVALDAGSNVAGLFVLDAATDEPWKPPPYAIATAFEERDTFVGHDPPLHGVLAMPKGAGPFRALVLVHGSGPQDEDESVGGVKVFKDLAQGLASRGVAVLRYTKRSRALPAGITTVKEEVIDGARAAVDTLRATQGIDVSKIFLLGHSQGGYLAPRIAHEDPRLAGLVILAGSTRPLEDLVVEQTRYLASLAPGAPRLQEAVEEAERLKAAVKDPSLTPDRALPKLAGGMTGAYFLDLRNYRPADVAASLACPILILWGARDYQVTQADFDGWSAALGASPRATLRRYPSLNHLFVAGEHPSTPAEYQQPGHVDARVIDDIATWILQAS